MDNIQPLQIELTGEERIHSLKWYQNQVVKIFEAYEKKIQSDGQVDNQQYGLVVKKDNIWCVNCFPDIEKNEQIHAYYMRVPYDFSTTFARVYCETQDGLQKNTSLYHLYRIELFKIMNLIDSLCRKICDYNIDESIFCNGFNLINARYAFIWIMCYSCLPQDIDAQDLNRLKAFYRLQLELKFKASGVYYNNQKLDREYKIIAEKIEAKDSSTRQHNRIVKCLTDFKSNLEELINETFDVYDILTKYRACLTNMDMKTDSTDLMAMRNALILAKSVCRIYLERFSAFFKIPDMNLGNSVLEGVYFTRSNASNSNFINSNFYMAQLDNAVMSDCDFSICNFTKVEARDAKFDNCTFNYSNMTGIDLENASLKNSLFDSVIFRDPQLDTNIEVAQNFVNVLEGKTTSEKLNELIKKRQEILNKQDHLNTREKFVDSFVREKLFLLYGKLSRTSDDKELWNITVAGEEDDSVHLCKTDENGIIGDYNFTVFDDIFEKVSKYLSEIDTVCSGRVISIELLDLLIEAQNIESTEDRRKRVSASGELCFEKSNLRGATITDSSLHQVDFSHISLRNASFENSDLSECMAYYSDAELASFSSAIVSDGIFYNSRFVDASFSKANCINSCFINCQMESVDLSRATAIGITIVNTTRERPFIGELLRKIPVSGIENNRIAWLTENIDDTVDFADEKYTLIDSNWTGIVASKCILVNILMDRSHFTNADLRNSLFFNTVMRWSEFENVDASYALLLGNSYHQSNLNHVNLSQSHGFACEFSGCQMLNSNFIGARYDKVIFYDSDLSDSNFSHCWFENCIFRECNFRNVNMSNVDFVNCVFFDIDFNDCVGMSNAAFKECIFEGLETQSSDSFDDDIETSILLKQVADHSDINVYFSKRDRTGKFDLYST